MRAQAGRIRLRRYTIGREVDVLAPAESSLVGKPLTGILLGDVHGDCIQTVALMVQEKNGRGGGLGVVLSKSVTYKTATVDYRGNPY